ncbi:hypothetical protein Patl1_06813 [Pistacia atlantica]|uniref:Uncharacterized protein n=1 Tax=Pistacia atlantica TaxID=434234 RepID=A0ACC1AJ93_9ROSI|nr:hypothetical protein Patl1_06813 [Pistacia atlantica]
MKENHLLDILSSQVKSEGKDEEIMAVANLTYRCVNLKGSKRPTMKEVSMELQRIRASENNNLHQNYEEVENMRREVKCLYLGMAPLFQQVLLLIILFHQQTSNRC